MEKLKYKKVNLIKKGVKILDKKRLSLLSFLAIVIAIAVILSTGIFGNTISFMDDTNADWSGGTYTQTATDGDNIILGGGVEAGDGSDGALIINSETVVNTYTHLTGNEAAGDTSIAVNSVNGFSAGDEILIIQMQHSNSAGTYEFKKINSISGNTLTLDSALQNSYYSETFNSEDAQAAQVVRVPQYTDVTINSAGSITANPWNGYTGGIVVFKATGTVNVAGSIDVKGKGFRGADPLHIPGQLQEKQGESHNGLGERNRNANNGAGGGGFVTAYNVAGGGGAGHATSGGNGYHNNNPSGSHSGIGGSAYGTASLNRIMPGSGGGAGSYSYATGCSSSCSQGGSGGGVLIVYASTFSVNGNVDVSGQNGYSGFAGSGGGGAGSGGSALIAANSISINGNFKVIGGIGGSGNYLGMDVKGGYGSVGRIKLKYNSLSGTTNPAHGSTESLPYSPSGTYVSRVFDSSSSGDWNSISWSASTTASTSVSIQTRTSSDNSVWSDWNTYSDSSGSNIQDSSNRYLQYKATLTTSDTSATPQLEWVNLTYLNITTGASTRSRIVNQELTNTSVFLLMKVQYYNSGTDSWEDEAVILDDTSPRRIQPGEANQLNLDELWNPNAWNSATNTHGAGRYRVYVAATDENNVILKSRDDTDMVATYNFTLIS